LGGTLSDPATNFPSIFGGMPFFKDYPYFLPCLVSSLFSATGFLLGFLFLEETNHQRRENEDENVEEAENLEREPLLSSASRKAPSPRFYSFLTPPSLNFIFPFSAISFVQIIFDEVFALWSSTEPVVGLAFNSQEIGLSLSFVGVTGLLVQSLLFPFFQRRKGTLWCYKHAMLVYALAFVLLPNVSLIALKVQSNDVSRVWLWTALLFVLVLRVVGSLFAFTSAMLLVSSIATTLF
jgi:hypothetical protein